MEVSDAHGGGCVFRGLNVQAVQRRRSSPVFCSLDHLFPFDISHVGEQYHVPITEEQGVCWVVVKN